MLIVHHLGKSQSERIGWLCEELALPYELRCYARDPVTMLAPAEYKALHPIGAAPVIQDGELVLAESGAIIEYILSRYGDGRLKPRPDEIDFPDYLYWFHFANATLQPVMGRNMVLRRTGLPDDHPVVAFARDRLGLALHHVDTRLGAAPYLAGERFSAADIMAVFSLTTMRYFLPLDISDRRNILAYLARIGERPAYRMAMRKGDPEMPLLLT